MVKNKIKVDYEDYSYQGMIAQAKSYVNLSKIGYMELIKTLKEQELDIFLLNELNYMLVLSKLQELDKEEYIAGFLIGYRKDHNRLIYDLDTLLDSIDNRDGWLVSKEEVSRLEELIEGFESLEGIYIDVVSRGIEKAGITDDNIKIDYEKLDMKLNTIKEEIEKEGFIDKLKKYINGGK